MKVKLSFSIIFSLFIIFSGCKTEKSQKFDDIIPVKIVELKKECVKKTVNVSGIFTTDDETFLSFKTGGIVKSIFVNEGDMVKKGQLLAVLDLTEIQAQVSQAKSGYEKASRDFNRIQNLYNDSVASLSQLQDSKTGLDVAIEQINIAKYNLIHSEIHALDNGYVLKKLVNDGQLISQGTPVVQTTGAVTGNWILRAGISDHDWSIIKVGDKALVQSGINPSEKIEGSVLRKSKGTDPYSGTFYVEIKITGKHSEAIGCGLFGKAIISTSIPSDMWVVPFQSVMDGNGADGFVFTTNNLKTVKKVKINISDIDKESVYINQGLEDSKFLVVSGSAYLDDNSQIKIENN